jgi:hypothetical protein
MVGMGLMAPLRALPKKSIFFLRHVEVLRLTSSPRPSVGGIASIYRQYGMNGASLFGSLKRQLRKKRAKNALNPLILFVDSTFLLLYSHRYIEPGACEYTGKPKNIQQKRRRGN